MRATQISNDDSLRFWTKNGFVRCPEPNPCNDHVLKAIRRCPDCGALIYGHGRGRNIPCGNKVLP